MSSARATAGTSSSGRAAETCGTVKGGRLDLGGGGNDPLTGGAGVDVFVFNPALNPAENVDRITDLQVGVDQVWLTDAIMSAGGIARRAFPKTGTGTATQEYRRATHNWPTGSLPHDLDGSGAGGAVAFAHMNAA